MTLLVRYLMQCFCVKTFTFYVSMERSYWNQYSARVSCLLYVCIIKKYTPHQFNKYNFKRLLKVQHQGASIRKIQLRVNVKLDAMVESN